MQITSVACCLAAVTFVAASADAQGTIQELSAAERRSAVNGALARAADPTMTAVASGPTPTLLLEASSSARIAAGRIGFQSGDFVFDIKLQGVVDSDTKRAVFADLDGLRHNSTAEVGFLWTNYPRRVSAVALDDACRKYEMADGVTRELKPCTLAALRSDDRGVAVPAGSRAAGPSRAGEVIHLLAPRHLFIAGISYRFGPEDFTYAPTPTADNVGAHRLNWAVNAKAGLVVSQAVALGVMYSHVVAYRAGDTRQICTPIGDGALECADRVVGAPTRLRSRLLTVEARRTVGADFAVAPRFVINLATRSVGVYVPLYFLKSTKGGLAGGITAGWRYSRYAGSTLEVSAFVGQVFSLLLR